MNNFSVILNGQEFWISRSVAVCTAVICFNENDDIKILIVKRGKGCPSEVGKWCLPCGYLDYDETLEQAAAREVFEETGVEIDKDDLYILDIDSNPRGHKQNVVIFFTTSCDEEYQVTTQFCEPDEVDEVKWISIRDFKNYKCAFDHSSRIQQIKEVYS